MQKITYISVLCALMILFGACSRTESVKTVPDYIPVQTAQNAKWSMMAPDGRLLFKDRFEEQPSIALEGAFSVKEGENFNLYRAEANPGKINKKPLVAVGNYSDGLIPATYPGERISLLNKDGEKVTELMPVDGKELIKSDIAFHDGLLVVTTPDGKFGYVNQKGEAVIKPVYDAALPFAFGYAMVAKVSDPSNPSGSLSVSIIDKKGDVKLQVSSRYTVIDLDLENQRLIVNDINGHLGFLDFKNNFRPAPAQVKNIGQILDGRFVYSNEDGLCGVMSLNYEKIIDPQYQHIEIVNADRFIVTTGREYFIVGPSLKDEVKLGQAHLVGYMEGFGYFVYDLNSMRLVDASGKIKGEPFKGISLNASACSSVRSDYQSAERIATDLASLPTQAGVGNEVWGTSAEQVAPAADYATGIYAALPRVAVSGVDYLLNAVAVFTAPVGAFSDSGDGADPEGFTYNPKALLTGVDFYFRSEAPITSQFISRLKEACAKKGFKVTKPSPAGSKGECFVMESGATAVIFCIPVSGHDANFFVYSKANEVLGRRWYDLLSKAAADGKVPDTDLLFDSPVVPVQAEESGYVDRSSRENLRKGEDSGERVSTKDASN